MTALSALHRAASRPWSYTADAKSVATPAASQTTASLIDDGNAAALDSNSNLRAGAFAAASMRPLSMEILEHISLALHSEMEQVPSANRREVLATFHDLR